MSETTTSTLREQHDAARREVLLKGMQDMEQESKLPTSSFGEKLGSLMQSYQDSGEAWPESPKWPSNEAVYAHIAERAQKDGGELRGYENIALSNMNLEMKLRTTEAAVDPAMLGDNKEAAIRELITESEALPDDDENKSRQLLSLNNVLVRMQPGAYQPRGDELATFVTNAESYEMQKDRETEGAIAKRFLDSSREELATVIENNEDDLRVLQLLAAKYPAPDRGDAPATPGDTEPQDQTAEQQQAPVEKSKELLAAEEKLDGLRTQLADMNARREKRMVGAKEAIYSEKVKQLKAAYQAASRDVFALQNPDFKENPDIEHIDKVKMIVKYTVDEATKLDEQILESHKNNKTKFGKFLEWYGKRGVPTKLAVGVIGGMFIGAATGGFGTAAWSGSLMAVSLEARNRAKREAGANMLQLDGTGGLLDALDKRLDGKDGRQTLETIDLDAAHDLLDADVTGRNEKRIGDAHRQRAIRIVGSYVAGATIGAITHNLPGGYFDGLHGPHDQVANAIGGHEGAGAAGVDPSHVVAAPGPDALHNAYVGPSHVVVPDGGGWNGVFAQMNIPHDQWGTILNKIGPDLIHHGDAMSISSHLGTYGVAQPGEISQYAFDAIKHAANLR